MPYDSMSAPDDDLLLKQFAGGDSNAAKALMDRHVHRILRLAKSMLGETGDAEEVTQEAMLRLWKVAPQWKPGKAKVSTWLWRVTSNLCIDRLRAQPTISIDSIDEPEDGLPSVDEKLLSNDRAAALRRALEKLPPRQRAAVALRHLEGLSNKETAESLGTSIDAVESLIARGILALKSQLLDRKGDLGWEK